MSLLCVAMLGASASCVNTRLTVQGNELLHHVPALRERGQARVDLTPSGTYLLERDQVVEATVSKKFLGITVGSKPKHMTVAEMVAHCPDVAPFANDKSRSNPPCLAKDYRDHELYLETVTRPDWSFILGSIAGAFLLGTATSVALCVVECDRPWDSYAALGVLGFGATLAIMAK